MSERWFRDLLESAPDAGVVTDGNGRIAIVNSQAEKLFGYRKEEMLGQAVEMLLPESLHAAHLVHRKKYAGTPRLRPMGSGLDLLAARKGGGLVPVEISLSPLETKEGTFVYAAVRDVSERRKAQEEIAKLNAELEDRVRQRTAELEVVNKELEAFSYSVSHDLRAPLRAIDGFSKILLEEHGEKLGGDAARFLELVRGNTRQMGMLVDDLLAFSRLGRQELRKTKINTEEIVAQALEDLRGEKEGRRVEIKVAELPHCRADQKLLKQVYVNLLSNALKYTRRREAAVIEVGARLEGGRDVFFVRDNGVGFDMKYADKLFTVFQRFHRQEEYEGTGVGLAIVQRIVHRHGGRVWAEAVPDKGATFSFMLEGGV